jgi:hypothetical protein
MVHGKKHCTVGVGCSQSFGSIQPRPSVVSSPTPPVSASKSIDHIIVPPRHLSLADACSKAYVSSSSYPIQLSPPYLKYLPIAVASRMGRMFSSSMICLISRFDITPAELVRLSGAPPWLGTNEQPNFAQLGSASL